MKDCVNIYNPVEDFANVQLEILLNPVGWQDWVKSNFIERDANEIIAAVANGTFNMDFKVPEKTNAEPDDTFNTGDDSTEDSYSAVPTNMSVKGFYYSQYNGVGNVTSSYTKMMREFTKRIMSNLVYDLDNKQIIDVTEQIDGVDRVNLFLSDYKIELIESLREVTHSDIDHLNFSDPSDLTKAINKVLFDYKNIALSDEAKPKYNDYVILSNFNKLLEERFDWIVIKPEYQNTTIHARDMYEYHDSKVKHRQSFENEKDEGGKSISEYTSSYMKRLLEFIPEVDKTGRDLEGLSIGFAGFSRVVTLIRDWALNAPEAPHKAYNEILKGADADFDYIIDAYLQFGIKTEYGTFLVNKIYGIQKYILGNNVPLDIRNLFIGQLNKMVSCRHIAYQKIRDPKTRKMIVARKDLRDRVSDLQSLRLRGTMRAVAYNNRMNPEFFAKLFGDRISVDKHGIITLYGNVYGRGNNSLTFTPEYDEETGNVKYVSANSLSTVDDAFTIELIRDVLQIDIPLDQVNDLKNLVREESLMQIFGQALAITIGASHDFDKTRFKYINDNWELDTSGYGNMVTNAAQCLSLLYGSETLNVLKDLNGNSIPVFQLGSLFYDIKKIINDLGDNNKGVYYGNNFVQNPKLLGEVYTRNDYDERGNVTKAKQASEADLNYLSAYQDFYVNLSTSKNILLQPTCYADKVRFAMFEVRTGLHKIGDYTASDLFSTIADSFETSETVDRGQTYIKKNSKKVKAKDAVIGEIARVRQDKIKRQMLDVISRLSAILNIPLPVSANMSYISIQNAVKKIHDEFARRGIKTPEDLRAEQKRINDLRVKNGKAKIDLCETYDVVIGKSGLEINEVLLNNAKLYWDWNSRDMATQVAFRARIERETMKYAKILYNARFKLNATYDASLNEYYKKLRENNPEEAKHWINSVTGKLKSFRLFEKGTRNEVFPDDADLTASFDPAKYDVELNPMLESYMLADMLYSNQITDILFGDVASYPNKVRDKQDLTDEEVTQRGEANRLVTMHKRTMVGGSTRHKMLFMPFGAPRKINIATVADIETAMWNLTGINKKDKTQDGCGFSSPYMTVMENWSYLDGAGTENRKTIFGYTDPKTGVFTEIKWACFDLSNEARRTSPLNESYSAEVMFQRMHSKAIGASIINLDFRKFWSKDSSYSSKPGYENKKISVDTDIYWWDDATDTHWKLISLQNNNGTVTRIKQQVNENGVAIGKPITEKPVRINNLAELDTLFGGCFNEILSDGKLRWGDTNVKIMSNIICEMDWKDKFTHYCINESAVKVGMWNINNSDSFAIGQSGELDTFEIDCSYGGIQMDASHLAEDGQVTEMMQTVASLIQNGYRADTVNDIYQTIGEIALDAMSDVFDAREISDKRAIYEILGKAFIKSLTTGEKDSLGLAQAFVTIAEQELYNKNIKITLPFSAATIKPKFMSVVTSFTNKSGIRRKYSGLGTVQAPSYGYMQYYDFEVVDQFGNKSKVQVDYKGAIGYIKRTLGIDDPKRALTDQNYALEKGLLREVTSNSELELEDTIVIRPSNYYGDAVGHKIKIVSRQQLDYYKNLLWQAGAKGAFKIYKWNGQPKDLCAAETTITINVGGVTKEIGLLDHPLYRSIFYAEDLANPKKRSMSEKDLAAVGGNISLDVIAQYKKKFLLNFLAESVSAEDIAEMTDPETGTSILSIFLIDPAEEFDKDFAARQAIVREQTLMNNLAVIIEYLKVKAQNFNIQLSELHNNRASSVDITPANSLIKVFATKVNYFAPEIMMSNSYKTLLGIKDGDNISDVTGPEYFIRNINNSFKFPTSSELDPRLYDAMLVTSEGEKIFVSIGGRNLPLVTDDSYQSIDGKVWHRGERVSSADGKTFGQYVNENGEKFHFVIVESGDRLQELVNSKHFNNVRYNYTESNAQRLLEHQYPDNFEDGQIITPIQLLSGPNQQGASISRITSIPNMIEQLRVHEQARVDRRTQQLAEKRYDAFIETLNFIGARIPTQSMQSFSAAHVVRFIDAPTNEVYLPRIVAWLEGSDYDIDKWYLMGLSLLQDGSIATFSNLSEIFDYKEVFKLPIPAKRAFQKYVPDAVDPMMQTFNFKRQDPKTAQTYNVTAYKLADSNNAIEVSKLDGEWHIQIIGSPSRIERKKLYSALSIDVLNTADTVTLHGDEFLYQYGFTKTDDGFIKPDESELYTVTPEDIANVKLGILEPLNRILRLPHSILKFDPTIDPQEADQLLFYLNMHERSERSDYEKTEALKNKVFYGIQDVVSDPIAQINLHTPIAMSDPQAAAANSTLGNEEKEFTSDNPGVKFKMQLQNMAGKDVTGIGAVSLKSFFAATYFFNRMASEIRDLVIELKAGRAEGRDTSQIEQDIFNRINWIVFDSKLGKSELRCLSNVYWKPVMDLLGEDTITITAEWEKNPAATHLENFISGNTIQLNDLISHLDKTSKSNNAADTISALVSAATDNAKELILAKINATSKFADIYTLLLSTGMPFKEISEFMMSPIFNIVNDFITPNMFDPRTKFLKVEDVVEFVLDKSSILVNSPMFDNVILHYDPSMASGTSFILKLIYKTNNEGKITTELREDSPLKPILAQYKSVSEFLSEYKTKLDTRFNPKNRKTYLELKADIFNILENSPLAQSILLEHLEDQIKTKKSLERKMLFDPNEDFGDLSDSTADLPDISEDDGGYAPIKLKNYSEVTSKEMLQLYDYVEEYLIPKMKKLNGIRRNIEKSVDNQIRLLKQKDSYELTISERRLLSLNDEQKAQHVENLYNDQKIKLGQLLAVLPACQEQQFLGRMLGVNKGLKTDDYEEYSWIRSFEIFVNERVREIADEAFDFLRFVSEEDYRNKFIELYEQVKAMYNPLRIVSTAQHFSSMLKLVETNRYLLERAAAVRLERSIAKEILKIGHDEDTTAIQNADTKKLSQKEFARLKTYVSDILTLNWFYNLDDLKIDVPEGVTTYRGDAICKMKRKFGLNSLDGLASFKHFMDTYAIPMLIHISNTQGLDGKGTKNSFLSNLTLDHRIDYRSGEPIVFYKPNIEMTSVDGTLKTAEIYESMLEGFNEICFMDVSKILGIETSWTFGDLFFIYDLITNKNGHGNESFARFFEDMAKFGNNYTLVNKFHQYLSELDNGSIDMSDLQYNLDDLRIRLADLPGAESKFGVKLNKDGNIATSVELGQVSIYGEVTWLPDDAANIPVQQHPSDYTFDIYKGSNRRTFGQTSKHEAYQVKGLNERIEVKPSSQEVIEAAVSRIIEMFGGKINLSIEMITTQDLRKMYETKSGPVTFIDDTDFDATITAAAFIHNGVIYVNTDFKFVDSPLHEVLHVVCAAMKLNPKYKDKYYEWMNKLRQEHADKIKEFEANYPNKKGSDLKEEVFIAMIGESFRNRFTDIWGVSRNQMRGEIKEAVIDVFNQIFLTEIDPKSTDGVSLGSTDLGYMLKIANTKLFNPENAYITRTCVPVTQVMATLKNKLIIEYGDEC